jgi:hypothetical protein
LTLPDDLTYGGLYWWRIAAIDRLGHVSRSPSASFHLYELGDLTNDFSADISDLTRMVSYMFVDLQPLPKPMLADLNGDCEVDILDLTVLIDHLFISFIPLQPGCPLE